MHSLRTLPIFLLVPIAVALPARADQQREQASRAPVAANTKPTLDLNTASEKALAAEAAIGPELARAIVAARPFSAVDELSRLEGITAERLEQIRAKVSVTSPRREPREGRLGEPAVASPSADSANRKLDLNTADVRELEVVPSIGPELARKIVAARPFRSVDDLNRVPGISAEQLELIRADVTVTPQAPASRK